MGINFKHKSDSYLLSAFIGFLLVAGLGCYLLFSNGALSEILAGSSYNFSFDLGFFARPDVKSSGVVIVYLDEKSHKDLDQPQNRNLDRRLYADLLNRLKKDGARAVVMDVVFSDPGPEDQLESDIKLADAIHDNGRVILGVDYNRPEEENKKPLPNRLAAVVLPPSDQVLTFPYEPFRKAAAGFGLVLLSDDLDRIARRRVDQLSNFDLERINKEERSNVPASLSWATAEMLGLQITKAPDTRNTERWINYYGPPDEAVRGVGFSEAFRIAPGFFTNKVVFVGARPKTGRWDELRDELRSPYSTLGLNFVKMPMVEIHATEFLNLMRGDWLTRPSGDTEAIVLVLTAFVLCFGLMRFRPLVAAIFAIVAAIMVVVIAQSLFGMRHVWFPWLIIIAQIPVALLFAIVFRSLEWLVQRRRLEAERRVAYERISEQAALLDKAQDAIVVHDLNWRAQYWNKSAENLYGWTSNEVQALDLKTDIFKTDQDKLLETLQLCLAKGEWTGELKQATKAGKALIVQSRWTLVRDEQGRPKSIFVINTDVTEQKKLEAQFLRTQRMESIGTLAGGIAHDLNNVLAPILMGVEMMRMKANDEFTNKMLTTMSSSARRGSDMVKQVLTFARGHEGERQVLQISHLVREMQKIVKETFPKSIDFKTAIGEGLWPILGDATQIHQIILNLCVNARDAMPDGGKIIVEARNVAMTEDETRKFAGAKPIRYVLLSATDTGTGIPPEIIDKIFEPFFTTKEIGKGTGLGLSTVISIIKSHGGFLDLQSTVGKGTSFNVYLPAADAGVPLAATPVPPEALRGEGETVMLVDDESAVVELTQQMLVHFGYKVVTAFHGADALALFPQYQDKIKVLIIDMMMPVMDGPTAIRAMRKLQPNLPVIAISGLMAGDKIHEQLGDVGVVFMPKPFTMEKLLLAVRDAVIGSGAGSGNCAAPVSLVYPERASVVH
ncbi:MAG: sensor hybrid histidine kinase [Pedosphaera sp.]|nr:sensor hybrid histidine kinase [Pedosphaera sp.]